MICGRNAERYLRRAIATGTTDREVLKLMRDVMRAAAAQRLAAAMSLLMTRRWEEKIRQHRVRIRGEAVGRRTWRRPITMMRRPAIYTGLQRLYQEGVDDVVQRCRQPRLRRFDGVRCKRLSGSREVVGEGGEA